MIDYHKYIGYCRSDEKREKPVGGAGGRWDEEKPVENKPVENKPVESGGTIQPIRPLGVEIRKRVRSRSVTRGEDITTQLYK